MNTYLISRSWDELIKFLVSQRFISIKKVFLPIRSRCLCLRARSWSHHGVITLHWSLHKTLGLRSLSRLLIPSSCLRCSTRCCPKSACPWCRSLPHHPHRCRLWPSAWSRCFTASFYLHSEPWRSRWSCYLATRSKIPSVSSGSRSIHAWSS